MTSDLGADVGTCLISLERTTRDVTIAGQGGKITISYLKAAVCKETTSGQEHTSLSEADEQIPSDITHTKTNGIGRHLLGPDPRIERQHKFNAQVAAHKKDHDKQMRQVNEQVRQANAQVASAKKYQIAAVAKEKQSKTNQVALLKSSSAKLKVSGTMQCWSRKILLRVDSNPLYHKNTAGRLDTPADLQRNTNDASLKPAVEIMDDLYGRLALMVV